MTSQPGSSEWEPMARVCARMGVAPSTVLGWAERGEVQVWQPGGPKTKWFVKLSPADQEDDLVEAWGAATQKA